jgi:hypothetical protein
MKLQRQYVSSVAGVRYFKFVVVLPADLVRLLQWSPGDDLSAHRSGSKIVIKKVR